MLREADLTGADLRGCDLTGADHTGALLDADARERGRIPALRVAGQAAA